MDTCLFCRIIRKEIPSQVLYEDGRVFAFLDINPVNPGHLLVVPKAHAADFSSADPDDLAAVIVAAQRLAKAAVAALGASGFNVAVNNGRVAGQLVDHMHLHVMPRSEGDGRELWHGSPYPEGEMDKVADKIRAALAG